MVDRMDPTMLGIKELDAFRRALTRWRPFVDTRSISIARAKGSPVPSPQPPTVASAGVGGGGGGGGEGAAVVASRTAGGSDDWVRNDQYPLGQANELRHPRNRRIGMKESTHTYAIDGESLFYTSVTTELSTCFAKFNAPVKARECVRRARPGSKYYGRTPEDVEDEWARNGTEQGRLGTAMHAQIERFFNGLSVCPVVSATVEWRQFEDFYRREWLPRRWRMLHAEWMIFCEALGWAGSMDAPLVCETDQPGEMIVGDWKRTKGIDNGPFRKGDTGFKDGPCADVPDSKQGHYAVQLNVYKYILEREYGMKVVGMFLFVFHPEQEDLPPVVGFDGLPCTYRVIEVKPLPHVIDALVRRRTGVVAKLREEAAEEQQEVARRLSAPGSRVWVVGRASPTDADPPGVIRANREEVDAWWDEVRSGGEVVRAAQKWYVAEAWHSRARDTHCFDTTGGLYSLSEPVMQSARAGKLTPLPDVVVVLHPALWQNGTELHLVRALRQRKVPVRVIGKE